MAPPIADTKSLIREYQLFRMDFIARSPLPAWQNWAALRMVLIFLSNRLSTEQNGGKAADALTPALTFACTLTSVS